MHSSRISWARPAGTRFTSSALRSSKSKSGGYFRRPRGKNVGNSQAVAFADPGDVAEDVRQLGAGGRRRLACKKVGLSRPIAPEGGFAALPDRDVLGLGPCSPGDRFLDRAAVRARTISAIAWASRSRPASRPSTSMINTAPASVGKPKAEGGLDRADHEVVEHLERSGGRSRRR